MGRRNNVRIKTVLPVRIYGMDATGKPFVELAHTLDISRNGARIGGFHRNVSPGDTLGLHYRTRKARFTVAWARQVNAANEFHLGIHCLEPEKDVFDLQGNIKEAPDEYQLAEPFKPTANRRKEERHSVIGVVEIRPVNSSAGVTARLADISASGCRCETSEVLPVMTRVKLILRAEGLETASFAVVRASRPGSMGLEFTQHLSPADATRFNALLDKVGETDMAVRQKAQAAEVARRIAAAVAALRESDKLLREFEVEPASLADLRAALGEITQTLWGLPERNCESASNILDVHAAPQLWTTPPPASSLQK